MARNGFVDAAGISIELHGLANVVLAAIAHDDVKDTPSAAALGYVVGALEMLSHRVAALDNPGAFHVERS